MMFDVVGLGCCCFDLLGVVPHLPEPDEEIRMLETRQQGGGEVATALVTLARLGCSVACAGKVGDDAFGNFIRRELDQYGVDIQHLLVEADALSQASVVLVDRASGQRSILACVPTFCELQPSQLPPGLIEQAKVLHLDGVHRAAALAAAGRARPAGVPVVLDADVLALEGDISELLRRTDILIASLAFASSFANTEDVDRAIDHLLDYGPSVVLVTLGERGCCGQAEGRRFHLPAFPGGGGGYHRGGRCLPRRLYLRDVAAVGADENHRVRLGGGRHQVHAAGGANRHSRSATGPSISPGSQFPLLSDGWVREGASNEKGTNRRRRQEGPLRPHCQSPHRENGDDPSGPWRHPGPHGRHRGSP